MIVKVSEQIYYVNHLPKIPVPKIGIVIDHDETTLIDVSCEKELLDEAINFLGNNNLPPIKNIILTHFHPDHIANLQYLNDVRIYCSKNTSRYLNRECIIVPNEGYKLNNIEIVHLPSLHAKGCLGALFEGYLFVGDAMYPRIKNGTIYYDRSIIGSELKCYQNLSFKEVIYAHEDLKYLTKEEILDYLRKNLVVSSYEDKG